MSTDPFRMKGRLSASEIAGYDGALLVACRSAVRPTNPIEGQLWDQLAPLDPGWESQACRRCGTTVRVGPRQLAAIKDLERRGMPYLVVCLTCGALLARAVPGGLDVSHLGGR